MARIAGVDLPNEKRVEIGLTYIFGIGLSTSKKILAATGINPDTRVRDLSEDSVQRQMPEQEKVPERPWLTRRNNKFIESLYACA